MEIEVVAGSSAGALIGGMYAVKKDIREIEEYFEGLKYRDLLKAFSDSFTKRGLFKGGKTEGFIRSLVGEVKIEKLKMDYAAVCTNILRGEPVVITKGDLATAIRTSGSLPFIFEPVKHGRMQLIDGAASMPVPVEVVRELGAEVVIAVNPYANLFSGLKEGGRKLTRVEVVKLSYYSIMSKLARENAKKADVVVEPQIKDGSFGIFRKFVNNMKIVEDGERGVRGKKDEIKEKMLVEA